MPEGPVRPFTWGPGRAHERRARSHGRKEVRAGVRDGSSLAARKTYQNVDVRG